MGRTGRRRQIVLSRVRSGVAVVVALVAVCGSTATADAKGTQYQAFASPQQESGPASGSTTRGQATITFDPYLTTAKVEFRLANLDPADISAFHIHCGVPGQLGPIIVDFGQFGTFTEIFKDGRMRVTLRNDNLTVATWPPTGSLPEGCATSVFGPGQSNTIAGLEALSRAGLLYFNLHTGSGMDDTYFFGLIRGQIYPK
jgi:hypothetical protein